jgi:hypothetical protein
MKRLYTLLLLLIGFYANAQTEAEPNNSFETVNSLEAGIGKTGSVNPVNDDYDYYRAILPVDGTMKIYVQGTNTSSSAGYLYMYGYDRRKANGQIVANYIKSSNIAAGATIKDTIAVFGRAADTFYIRLQSSQAFSYSIRYEMLDVSTNDAEPNNTFETSIPIAQLVEKEGHIGYRSNGSEDALDYYKTALPKDGTLKIYVKGINNNGSAGYLYLYGYDKRKANGQVIANYIKSSNTPAGATIYDTITLHGRGADSFFFRIQSSVAFSYTLKYDIVDTSANDAEPNNTFEQPIVLDHQQLKKGHIGYLANGSDDAQDYYRTILPFDGTLKIFVKGTNRSGGSGYLYLYGFDKRKAGGQVLATYIAGSSNIKKDSTIVDTITIYGLLADTFYFRMQSSVAFSYDLSYQMTLNSPLDDEPNNTFEQSVSMNQGIVKNGQVGHQLGGNTDEYDYFKTVLPADGTLKIYVKGTNNSAGAGYLYMYGYDRRKANGQIFGNYIASSNTSAGKTIYDTITVYGRAADTFYFRLQASQAFSYSFSYDVVETSENDAEPNNTFDDAVTINHLEEKNGHAGYRLNGVDDADDYYRTVLPYDGTLKIYVKGTNNNGAGGYLYMYGYDRRKANGQLFSSYIMSSNTAAGATVYDTLTVYGRAADTFYFRIQSSGAFSYSFKYDMVDTSENDGEPNDVFTDTVTIAHKEEKKGHIGYRKNGGNDAADYYRTVLPYDGTLKVYVKGTNTNGAASYLYMYGYDRRKSNGQLFASYIKSSNTAAGATIYDTLTLHGSAADTFYFLIQSSGAFSYSFKYDMVDTSENDLEPNDLFAEAIMIAHKEEKKGHIGYRKNGAADADDYYRTVLPEDGTLKIYVQGTNQSGAGGYLYMYGYDRRKANGQVLAKYVSGSSNIKADSTINDTILVTCRAADTLYFRMISSAAFKYRFKYEMVNTSPNDAEPNNTVATGLPVAFDSANSGHIGYLSNGVSDAADHYYTALPARGAVQIIVEGTNTSGGGGYLHIDGYRNRAATQSVLNRYISGSSNVAAGVTIRDTIMINCLTTDTLFLKLVSSGCFRYTFKVKFVDLDPIAQLGHNVAGSLHEFSNLSSNAMSYIWKVGDSTFSVKNAPELQSYGPGGYLVKLIAKNTVCNYSDTASLMFTVNGLDRFTPKKGGAGNIAFTAYGGGFHQGMQVLLKQGGKVYRDSLSYVNQYGNIFAALIDMHGAPQGIYDVEIKTNDTTYLIAGGYVSEPTIDRLQTEIIGANIIRMNTKTPYAVRIHNEGNTVAGVTEVYVLFPSYMTVDVLDSLTKLVNYQFDDINLDTVPLYRRVTKVRGYPIDGNLYSFYVAGIPAGGFRDLTFSVKSAVGKDKIYAWVKGPASGSEYKPWFDPCNEAKVKMVLDALVDGLSAVPIVDCAVNVVKGVGSTLYSGASWLLGYGAPSAASLTKTGWGILKNCAGEALAAAGFAPGVAAEIADALGDIAILGSNIDLNAELVKAACADEPEEEEEKPVEVRTSLDPNAKSGPSGYAALNYINGVQKLMNYTIFFENMSSATLPAQEVIVKDTLDKSRFNLATFRALSYTIGANKYHIPGGAFDYSTDVPFNNDLNVRLSINLDTATGVITAHFKIIDKSTGQVTINPLAGFLPPNVTAPEGEGNISFAIDLKNGLDDGTVIRNKASIIFDTNEPIITDEWFNTLDRNLPSSHVSGAYQLNDSAVVVKAAGNDPSSGVRKYHLYVSDNNSGYSFAGNMSDTAIYPAKLNHTYKFYVAAIDSVGNLENKAPSAEATISVTPPLAILLGNITAINAGLRNRIDWNTLTEDLGDRFEVEKSTNGRNFTLISKLPAKGTASAYTIYDEQPADGRNHYRLKTYDRSAGFKTSKIVSVYVLKNKVFAIEAFPNPVKDRLNISIHGSIAGRGNITVVNMLGRTVLNMNITTNQLTLDLGNQPAGTYFVKYTDSNKSEVIKISKQ